MQLGANIGQSAEIASLMGWWQDAGLDTLIDETPRNWLAPVARSAAPAPPPVISPAPAPAPAAPIFPDTLPAFHAWLAGSEALTIPRAARVAPAGDPASGLMILVDLPDAEDAVSGRLLSGPAGELFDKMIAAMKRSRDSIYLAAMAPGRPSGGYVDKASGALFVDLARHHVMLARPRALLLMGEQPSRALLGQSFVEARGRTHDVIFPGGAATAIATFHPRTLHRHPEHKKRAWADLQLLMKIFE